MAEILNEQNKIIVERFSKLVNKDRLAHAYLFVGPKGVGKIETAKDVAKFIICEQNNKKTMSGACGQCSSCLKVDRGNHPDIYYVNSNYGETIKVEEIRSLINWMQMRPFEALKKIVIMQNIENLTLAGANAILKTLEEPSTSNVMLLTTSVPEQILGTVKSRCHAVYFSPLSQKKLAMHLRETCGLDEDSAHFLAFFSEGSAGKAEDFNAEKVHDTKNKAINYFISSKSDEGYMKKILIDKAKTKETLDILLSWLRDIMLLKAGACEEHAVHCDRIQDLRKFAKKISFNDLKEIIEEVVKTTKLLNDNLNIKIALNLVKEKIQAA